MKRFYQELKRRRIFRVAVVYAVVAWLLVQVAAVTFPALQVPGWGITLVVLLLLIGFPVALVLAWAFEATPEGVRRTPPDEGLPTDAPAGSRLSPTTWLWIGVAVAVVGLGFVALRGTSSPDATTSGPDAAAPVDSAPAAIRSIAVLPFTNLSADGSNEYFSDGITEDILTALAKIGDFHVISRTSSMAYKGTDKTMRAIGEELGVGAILEGSVRRQGDQIRIVAQLIDARDDRQMWAETYDRELTDLFAIQSEIAEAIAAALETELDDVERGRIVAGGTEDLDAYELYLRGREADRRPGPENNEAAIALFRRALELDPDYALAHAGLSAAYGDRQPYEGVAWGDSAILSAARAISLDPRTAEGYAAMAGAQWLWGLRDIAVENLRLALERNPNDADAVSGMAAALAESGRLDEALEWALRAAALEPNHASHYGRVGWILAELGADEAAIRWFEERSRVAPDDPESLENYFDFHLHRGRLDRAEAYLEKMRDLAPERTLDAEAGLAMARGDLETALEKLEAEYQEVSEQWEPRHLIGWVQARLGHEEEAEASLRQAEEMVRLWMGRGDQGIWAPMVLAHVHLARGDIDAAIDDLEQAFEKGARDARWMRTHPPFEPLQGHPRFEALLDRVEAEVERMREAVDADSVLPPRR